MVCSLQLLNSYLLDLNILAILSLLGLHLVCIHLTYWCFNSELNRVGKHNREEVLEKAEKDLAAVTDQYMSRLVKELQGTDFWKLRRAYSPGVAFSFPNL